MSTVLEKHGCWIALLFVAAMAIVALAQPVIAISVLTVRDPNEGWNAFQAVRAFSDEPLYPPFSALTSNPYPPLSFFVVGALGALVGDNIVAGRLVALVSLFVIGLCLGYGVRSLGGSPAAVWFSGLLFIGFMAAEHGSYVAMNDPQWLAHAIMMSGFVLFLRRRESRSRLVLAMLIMVGAGLVKHNLIALPLTITLWLLFHDRQAFRLWIISCVLAVTGSLATLYLLYGWDFFVNVFGSPRVYDATRVPDAIEWLMTPLLPWVAAALVLVASRGTDDSTRLVGLYLLVSGIWGFFIIGGQGVDRNAVFDLIIALTMTAGLALHHVAHDTGRGTPRRGVEVLAMAILSLPLMVAVPKRAVALVTFVETREAREAETRKDIAYIAAREGPVVCENLAYCYWAGKDFELDRFNYQQKLKTGARPDSDYIALIDSQHFALIQTYDRRGISRGMPTSVREHIRKHYKLVRPLNNRRGFLVPRDPK